MNAFLGRQAYYRTPPTVVKGWLLQSSKLGKGLFVLLRRIEADEHTLVAKIDAGNLVGLRSHDASQP